MKYYFRYTVILTKKNNLIDSEWKSDKNYNNQLVLTSNKPSYFIKFNSYISNKLPACYVFTSNINNWKDLKSICGNREVIAGLYNNEIYCFGTLDLIKIVFEGYIKSDISLRQSEDLANKVRDAVYIGMLYQLIEITLKKKCFLTSKKNKYYIQNEFVDEGLYRIYDSLEVQLSINNNGCVLSFIPSYFITDKLGKEISKEKNQFEINNRISKLYNKQYDEKIRNWEKRIITSNRLEFVMNDFQLCFNTPAISFGDDGHRNKQWDSLVAYQYSEPLMAFDQTLNKTSINQLKGLVKYGPLDSVAFKQEGSIRSIQLAILTPRKDSDRIIGHLNNLKYKCSYTGTDAFFPNYEGFENVFKRGLSLPNKNSELYKDYDDAKVLQMNIKEYTDFLKRGIDYYSTLLPIFDILIIYIPKTFVKFRESDEDRGDFNLHDAIKLYGANKGVKIQFIEEKSLTSFDICRVYWGLSTSIYTKASGVIWQPKEVYQNTAYIGLSYAQSKNVGVCIGCSQLFDSTGTGLRMILQKIDNPIIRNKNPYMKADEARQMMTSLREEYYKCNPTAKLNRIVVHKTTPFIREEIEGITQAFRGIDSIDLIQIQEYNPWRAIRFKNSYKQGADSFSVHRGLATIKSDTEILLWTHGVVESEELANKAGYRNYYKGGRGIPAPLLIKRFYGRAEGDVLVKELLMLTKMNWNSGGSLYKVLPVTLDFAKVLSRMSKQEEAIYNISYDFRFFM